MFPLSSALSFSGGVLFSVLGYFGEEDYLSTAISAIFYGAAGWAFFYGFSYVVKAACIYIEKEETENK